MSSGSILRCKSWVRGGVALGLTLAGLAFVLLAVGSAWGDDPPPSPVAEAQQGRILEFLGDVGLDHSALAALNLSAEQAEDVVSTARTWYFANEQTLNTARGAMASASWNLADARKDIRTGEGSQESVAQAQSALNEAKSDLDDLRAGLRTAVAAECTASQRALWATLEANKGRPMPFRLLALSAEKAQQLGEARKQLRSNLARAGTAEQRQLARATWRTEVTNTLSAADRTMLSAYRSYIAASTANLAAAIEAVLPTGGGE